MLEDIELADRLLAALANLSCIEEYIIEWKHGVEAERPFCLPLLLTIWPLYGHNLRIIKLDMMLTNLCDMLGSVTGLDRVQELSINLTCNHGRFGHWGLGESEAKDAFERLATFMNRLALTLQSLTLSSIGHLNFSLLYCNLSYFPHLIYLALLVPCDPHHVVDPTALYHFLHAHHTINHLNFSPQYCCYQSSLPPEIDTKLVSTEDWLNRCFSGITFQNLHHLELGLNILGSGGKRVMLPVPYIGHAARNVHSLAISGRIISLKDLALILNPFSRAESGIAPRTLVLEVHVLDVNLLDLLADHLPDLVRLDLTYSWVHSPGCTSEVCFILLLIRVHPHVPLLLRRRLFKKFMVECTHIGNYGKSYFAVRGIMMMLVGHANKLYHGVYLDYRDLLFLWISVMDQRLFRDTLFLIYILLNLIIIIIIISHSCVYLGCFGQIYVAREKQINHHRQD